MYSLQQPIRYIKLGFLTFVLSAFSRLIARKVHESPCNMRVPQDGVENYPASDRIPSYYVKQSIQHKVCIYTYIHTCSSAHEYVIDGRTQVKRLHTIHHLVVDKKFLTKVTLVQCRLQQHSQPP